MRRINYTFIIKWGLLILTLFFWITPGMSQEDRIIMNHEELGIHSRPLVIFPHNDHEGLTECIRCHHDYDEYMTNIGGDEGKCSDCHQATPGSNPINLTKAIHIQCKSCHMKSAKTNVNKGPVMCGQCHIR
ncbi:MAG: cytochrome c3 family protein [Desulfobacterales bacterium]|jgi:hypothetical protein|nr:cytochrome c3 family protein [Desulfobacteraceae bacterium]MBT4364173.1 cytochrome c3 family protein [Desulfobacteraceae bacterium]MBT7086715.1 cytochrome c3 family protein [Desulfobacterales bacterium]MBT7697719.1 cytochrome c3 family protein [Desulfobacterales bacterium]